MNKKMLSGLVCTVIGIIGLSASLYYGSKLSSAQSSYETIKKHSDNNIFGKAVSASADKTFSGFHAKITYLRIGSILVAAIGMGLILKSRKD